MLPPTRWFFKSFDCRRVTKTADTELFVAARNARSKVIVEKQRVYKYSRSELKI